MTTTYSADGNTKIVQIFNGNTHRCQVAVYSKITTTPEVNFWTLQSRLEQEIEDAGVNFGYSVAISADGGTVIVGSPCLTVEDGDVHVFNRDGITWARTAKLNPSVNQKGRKYGSSVSISGDGKTVIVGDFKTFVEQNGPVSPGQIYIYVKTELGWKEQPQLLGVNDLSGCSYGNPVSISLDGNSAIIGEIGYDHGKGRVHILNRDGEQWIPTAVLKCKDGEDRDYFGLTVGISPDGKTAFVGTPFNNRLKGAVYIFELENGEWSEKLKLSNPKQESYEYFGSHITVSPDGNTIQVESSQDKRYSVTHAFHREGDMWKVGEIKPLA